MARIRNKGKNGARCGAAVRSVMPRRPPYRVLRAVRITSTYFYSRCAHASSPFPPSEQSELHATVVHAEGRPVRSINRPAAINTGARRSA